MKGSPCKACAICTWVLVVAGVHLGLMGVFEWDLLGTVAGDSASFLRVMYIIIGVAAVGIAAKSLGMCKNCKMGCGGDACKHGKK